MTRAAGQRRGRTATLGDIVSLILPGYPALDPAARQVVEADVTDYVAAQIRAMPDFLRLPYWFALLGFEHLSLLRHGRRFRRLPPARRAAWLALWTDAPLAPMRDFCKLIRSTALLVYFDHPLVRARLDAERRADTH